MNSVILPPDLEGIAADLVAQGRYSDVGEVVRAAVRLLQRTAAKRLAFMASLEEAEAEAERDREFTFEEVQRETAAIIEAAERREAAERIKV